MVSTVAWSLDELLKLFTGRAQDLGIEMVYQGVWDKRPVLAGLLTELNLTADQVAVIGDDVVDIPLMRRAEWDLPSLKRRRKFAAKPTT